MNHPLSDMMMSSMGKIRDMIDVNTVIGAPIAAGDVTIIPVTKVSIGYGAGGSDFATKNYPANRDNAFGGGAGAGVNITPVAFLVVRGESVRMLPVAEPASTSMDRLIEQLPDLLDKAEHLLKQKRLVQRGTGACAVGCALFRGTLHAVDGHQRGNVFQDLLFVRRNKCVDLLVQSLLHL